MSKWHRSDRTPSAYNKVVAWPIVETALLGSVQSARTKLYCSSRTPLRWCSRIPAWIIPLEYTRSEPELSSVQLSSSAVNKAYDIGRSS